MTNAEAFYYDFGIYATKLWAMTEAQFLEWLNADCDRERPNAVPVVRCKDCKYSDWWGPEGKEKFDCDRFIDSPPITPDWYCAWGEKREDENN